VVLTSCGGQCCWPVVLIVLANGGGQWFFPVLLSSLLAYVASLLRGVYIHEKTWSNAVPE